MAGLLLLFQARALLDYRASISLRVESPPSRSGFRFERTAALPGFTSNIYQPSQARCDTKAASSAASKPSGPHPGRLRAWSQRLSAALR